MVTSAGEIRVRSIARAKKLRAASLLYKREDARDLAEISGLADAGWIDTAWINTGSEGLDAPSHFILGIGSAHRGGIRSRVFCGDGDCLPAIVG